MYCFFRFDAFRQECTSNRNPGHQYDRPIWEMIEVNSKVPENPCPVFCRCAMPVCIRFFLLWRTGSGADWIYFEQNSKIHPFRHQTVSLPPGFPTCCILPGSENKGWFLKFFFKPAQTVSLLIPNTRPMSRTPLPFRVIATIFSFTPFWHAL